jgi:hypothetical protein
MDDPLGIPKVWRVYKSILPPVLIGKATITTDQTVFAFSMILSLNNVQKEFHSDALRSSKNQTIYFVNRSGAELFITFPDSATFEIEGASTRQATTIPLDGFESEILPSLEMVPRSILKWDGDTLLDLNGKPMY